MMILKSATTNIYILLEVKKINLCEVVVSNGKETIKHEIVCQEPYDNATIVSRVKRDLKLTAKKYEGLEVKKVVKIKEINGL